MKPSQPEREPSNGPGPEFIEGRHYIVAETGCWEWQLFKHRGYGKCDGGYAHRVAYLRFVGAIPHKHDVHHICENPGCINPAHLKPIAHSDHLKHHMRGRSKFTPADVRTIRERAAAGERLYLIAEDYDVHRGTVEWIAQGRMWKDVGGPLTRPVAVCQYDGCEELLTGRRTQQYCCRRHREMAAQSRKRAAELAR